MDNRADWPSLDFLRSVAVLDVLVAHSITVLAHDPALALRFNALGFCGVLLFFVHTSLVLMLSLQRQRQSTDRLWTSFLVRRCFRIYPLSIVVVATIVLFRIPGLLMADGSFGWQPLAWHDVLANLLLVRNLTRSRHLLSPLWSLPYEMQMYLVLPLLFLFTERLKSARPLFYLWTVVVVAAVAQPFIPHTTSIDIVRYAPCFLAGVIAFRLVRVASARLRFAILPAMLLAAGAVAVMVGTEAMRGMTGWAVCLAIGCALPFVRQPVSPMLKSVSHMIARYSYSIYLGHSFCLWLAFQANHWSKAPQIALFAVSICAMPVLLYHGVEAPMISLGRRLVTREKRREALVPTLKTALQPAAPSGD